MGVAVFNSRNEALWALSVTEVESRFTPERRRIGGLLLEQVHVLTRRITAR